ncbi:MAG TPA: glycosyltransferase, partial [Candidatus Sulfopaludibacter sp.]|nr:glycosyltransferase [Candidatus Sulfopaludibacter sp.]
RDAMSNILDHLGERFNREFHASIRYSGRLDVIPLCTDTEKFRPQEKGGLRKRMRIPKDALVLLYLGYISPLKAELLPLLRVFRDLTRDCRRRRLLLVIAGTGDSGYAQGLDSYIRSLSLSKQVRVLENLSDEEKVSLTAAADIFVSPGDSIQESFGLTPIEAMSCGVPQVVADWDGYRDTVSHGETGFLVPTYWTQADGDLRNSGHLLGWEFDHLALSQSVAVDLEKLYTYLKLLIEDDSLRRQMSLNSRKRAESLYSFAALSRRYESLWEELAEIASCHPPVARGVNFDQPRYFDCFKNHATSAVTDDCGLEVTPLGRRTTGEDLQPLLHSRMSLFKTVDTDLALSALDELRKASGSTLGECVRAAARSHAGIHPDYARRNVMWLMKHGFLRPAARGEGAAGD